MAPNRLRPLSHDLVRGRRPVVVRFTPSTRIVPFSMSVWFFCAVAKSISAAGNKGENVVESCFDSMIFKVLEGYLDPLILQVDAVVLLKHQIVEGFNFEQQYPRDNTWVL